MPRKITKKRLHDKNRGHWVGWRRWMTKKYYGFADEKDH